MREKNELYKKDKKGLDRSWISEVNYTKGEMKKLKLIGLVGKRTTHIIKYHGRSGHPIIHVNKTGKRYIMVRKSPKGVKRLYEGSEYKVD